jgi:hypothetical protein
MTAVPLTDQQLVDAVAAAITADAMKPRAQRVGLVHAMLAVVQPELDRFRDQAETLQVGAIEREALLAEARDVLEAAGQNGAHGDDWPAVAPAISALAAELEQARQQTEAAHCRLHHIQAYVEQISSGDDPVGVGLDLLPWLDGPLHPDHVADYRAAQAADAPGCGCQTYVHPCHYPSCPTRTAQPSA